MISGKNLALFVIITGALTQSFVVLKNVTIVFRVTNIPHQFSPSVEGATTPLTSHQGDGGLGPTRQNQTFRIVTEEVSIDRNHRPVIPYDEAGKLLVTHGTVPRFGVVKKIKEKYIKSTNLFHQSIKGQLGRKNMMHFVYNPALLPLTGQNRSERIGITANGAYAKAAYLATFRVSNFGHCPGPDRRVLPSNSFQNYLGLALLDSDLQIVNGTGSYFQLLTETTLPKNSVKAKNKGANLHPNYLQDCSLYDSHNLFHLVCNGYIAPVTIRIKDDGVDLPGTPEAPEAMEGSMGMLRLFHDYPWIELDGKGKNLHIFEDINKTTFVELWPTSPKVTVRVKLEMGSYTNKKIKYGKLIYSAAENDPPVRPSFTGPMETAWKPLHRRERGTACCVSLMWNGTSLRVGVAHVKDYKGNYLNRLYAFEPVAPFREVAKSGYFCLGFGERDARYPELLHQDYGDVSKINLCIVGQFYDCPKVQFVTGISEKADDPKSVIIAYRVNDCYPRMVVVSKQRIMELLFPSQNRFGS